MQAEQETIEKIELLTHPFFDYGNSYGRKEAVFLFKLWKKRIEEVRSDPKKMLLFVPIRKSDRRESKLCEALKEFAKKRLEKRFAVFSWDGSRSMNREPHQIIDSNGRMFENFRNFMAVNGFAFSKEKIITRGFGEYSLGCATSALADLNAQIGMKQTVPYRNRQSTILWKESVPLIIDLKPDHPFPWEIKQFVTTGKKQIKKIMNAFARQRRKSANDNLPGNAKPFGIQNQRVVKRRI